MKLRLMYGPSKCGKTNHIIRRFTGEAERLPIIIAPSSEYARHIRNRISSQTALPCPYPERILTFDHIARTAGQEEIREISSLTKYLIIKDIIVRSELTYFSPVKRFKGFYKIICRFISELKAGEISPVAFLRGIEKKGASEKDREIYKIYLEYHKKLQKLGVYDHEGMFRRAPEVIDKKMPAGMEGCGLMLIDGFINFSPSELKIVKSLSMHIPETCITLCMGKEETDAASPALKAYRALKKTFGQVEETELPSAQYMPLRLNIVSCPSPAGEIEEIAREIRYLTEHRGKKPEEIGIMARDINIYKEIIGDVFTRYKIPYRISCGRVLYSMPLFRNTVSEFAEREDMPELDYFTEYTRLFKKEFYAHIQEEEEEGYNRFSEETEKIISSGAGISLLSAKISRRAFCAVLTEIAEYAEYRRGETADKCTGIMDAHTGRGMHFPVLFIAGMIEGRFPLQRHEDPLYNDTERNLLRECGIEVEDSKSMQEEEIFLFRASARAAGDALYLTYPALDTNGRDTLPSWFIEEARAECAGRISVKAVRLTDVIPESDRIFTEEDFIMKAAAWGKDPGKEEEITHQGIPQTDRIHSILKRAEIESARHTEYNGIITDKGVLRDIHHKFGEEHKFSISQFNEYGVCPFSFFCKRVLDAEPEKEPEDEILPVDEGTLYHSILREVFCPDTSPGRICARHFRRAESDGLVKNSALWEIKKKEIIKNINNIVSDMRDEAEFYEIKKRPVFFEISFGMKKEEETDPSSKEAPLTVGDIKIQGKIDRIDITDSDMFVVVDYKTGTKSITSTNITNGTNLQLPVYIMAAEEALDVGTKAIGGYFYYVKSKKSRRRGILRRYNRAKKKLMHNPSWDKYMRAAKGFITEYAGRIRSGEFPPVPRGKCPGYCSYKNICRHT